jgi:hypothetical protein
MVFHEPTRRLFGTLSLKGDEKESATVALGQGGAVMGRLIGEEGKPLAGVAVHLHHRNRPVDEIHDYVHRVQPVETGADGKFRIDDIVPGIEFDLSFRRGKQQFVPLSKTAILKAEPGKATEAGVLLMKPKAQSEE